MALIKYKLGYINLIIITTNKYRKQHHPYTKKMSIFCILLSNKYNLKNIYILIFNTKIGYKYM